MPNIATALKEEISRIARKQVKSEVFALRKAATSHRKEIAELKRRAQSLEQSLRRLGRTSEAKRETVVDDDSSPRRFSAKGLLSHRRRLGLSASDVGLLFGTTSQTVYNWEQGKSRPGIQHLPAIAALRTLGKRDAAAVIAARTPGFETAV